MLKNVLISLSGPVIKVALNKLQQLNRRYGPAILFTQQRCIMVFINY